MMGWGLMWAWFALARALGPTPAANPPVTLLVPNVAEVFEVDGETEEPFWTRRASRTGAFVDAQGLPARPFAEAHFAWGADGLRLALYAADHDIGSGDAFMLAFEVTPAPAPSPSAVPVARSIARALRVDPHGAITAPTAPTAATSAGPTGTAPAFAHTRAKVDVDGTRDHPGDEDEEWVVELAIPWADLGLAAPPPQLVLTLARIDATSGSSSRTIARWGTRSGRGALQLGPVATPAQNLK